MKPILAVKNAVKGALLIYEHGLGDIINFLPVYKEFCNQVNRKVTLGCHSKRQFKLINKNVIYIDHELSLKEKYDYIYKVMYPDSTNSLPPIEHHNESAKPYLCAYYELGMSEFTWTPYKMYNPNSIKNSNRVGIHLFGHTGMMQKFCPNKTAELIWKEVEELGYEPFEVHMIPQFANEYSKNDRGHSYELPFLNKNNSLRFEEPDLQRMIDETSKCRFFIGIDSGPIYLASALIGCENIVGLYNGKRHDHFLPKHISMVNVGNYKKDTIKRILKQKGSIKNGRSG